MPPKQLELTAKLWLVQWRDTGVGEAARYHAWFGCAFVIVARYNATRRRYMQPRVTKRSVLLPPSLPDLNV